MENSSAPEPEKKKELKTYSFTRNIFSNEKDEETPGNNENKNGGNTLNLTLTLYDKEISLIAQKENISPKLPNIIYEKYISSETLQGLNKIFSILDTEKIFTIIKNSFEQKLDHITIEEDKIIIKLMINFMEVMTEEIVFELEQVKMSEEEEVIIVKESIKSLTEEKKNLKEEVAKLKNTIEELKKSTSEKDEEISKKLGENKNDYEKKLEENKNEFNKKLEENKNDYEKKFEENKNEFNKKLEENKNDYEKKFEENKNEFNKKLEENKNEYEKKLKEKENENNKKENEIQNILKKLQEEMSEVKEIEKYVKEKIIIEEKKEKEIKFKSFNRKNKIAYSNFRFDINIILLNETIKFKIEEIQDDLNNNPSLYENEFPFNYFGKLSDYYKNQGGINAIFDFLVSRFRDEADKIDKKENKIIIKIKYIFGGKENQDEIKFELNKKEIGLKNVLTNFDKSLRDVNKELINTKKSFEDNLFEKVYPVGSYYWSEKNTSPGELFGGKWQKIEGKFLFASNFNHHVGETGGEERHMLTEKEMPSHSHKYTKFYYYDSKSISNVGNGVDQFLVHDGEQNSSTVNSDTKGGSQPHENMPPYLVANCWKRIK